jgi:hypothetical protein
VVYCVAVDGVLPTTMFLGADVRPNDCPDDGVNVARSLAAALCHGSAQQGQAVAPQVDQRPGGGQPARLAGEHVTATQPNSPR